MIDLKRFFNLKYGLFSVYRVRVLIETMLLKREIVHSFYKILDKRTITRIWADDGWCYVPEFGERHKFIEHSADVFEFRNEIWNGIIPSCEYQEPVEYVLITKKPLVWVEKTQWACEKFQETTANSSM